MATLSQSELLTLLGPAAAFVDAAPSRSRSLDEPSWNQFAELFSSAMTTRLRPLIKSATRMKLASQATTTAGTLSHQTDGTVVIRLWQNSGFLDPIAVALSPEVVASFVDRILGGGLPSGSDSVGDRRGLSSLDQKLADRLTAVARDCFVEAATLEPQLSLVEMNSSPPTFTNAWMPDCLLVRLRFDLRFVQGGGAFELLLPMEIAERLTDAVVGLEGQPTSIETAQCHSNVVAKSPKTLELVARLASLNVPRNEISGIQVGDVLLTDIAGQGLVEIVVDGLPCGQAIAGTTGSQKGVRRTDAQVANIR